MDASDTSLTYSVVSVAPSSLGAGNFSVAAKSGSALEAELSFVGAATVVDHDSVQSFTVTVRAADGSAQVDQAVSVTVQENTAPTVSVAVVGTPTLQHGTELTLKATATDANIAAGDVLSYAWSVASASSNADVSDLTLTPTGDSTKVALPDSGAIGAAYAIQVVVTDLAGQTATDAYTLVTTNIAIPVFGAVVDDQSFAAQYGIEALQLPAATGGNTSPTYSLTATVATGSPGALANGLPDGLTFTASTRTLSGTPAAGAVGLYDMTYRATDSTTTLRDTLEFQLTVTVNRAPVFDDAAKAMVEASYSYDAGVAIADLTLPVASGGEGTLTYSLTATSDSSTTANIVSNLPVGLTFDASSRVLAGTPTAADSYSLIYAADDSDSNSAAGDTATIEFAVVVAVPPVQLVLSGGVADNAAVVLEQGVALSVAPITLPRVTSGAVGTVAYTLTSNPTGGVAGLTLTADNGTTAGSLSGSPSAAGAWTLTYTATDDNGTPSNSSDDAIEEISFTVEVVADTVPALDRIALPALSGQNFNYTGEYGYTVGADATTVWPLLTFAGGTAPIAESLTTTCALNGGACAADAVTTMGTSTVPQGLTFAVAVGDTPAGLTGTFAGLGVYTLTYSVTDTAIGNTTTYQPADGADVASVTFTFTVTDAQPDLAAEDDRTYLMGEAVSTTLMKGNGGRGALTYSLQAVVVGSGGSLDNNNLPAGLTFDASSRLLAGSPTAEGVYRLTYAVTDAEGDPVAVSFTLTVVLGVCSGGTRTRTSQVSAAIISAAGKSACGDVTAVDLASITSLDASGSSGTEIARLNDYDFEGLGALVTLDLSDNNLSDLPAGTAASAGTGFAAQNALALQPQAVFAPVAGLESLDLSGNQFSALEASYFSSLVNLKVLNLGDNQFSTLGASYFSGLANLEVLDLSANQLTQAGLPAGVFAGLFSLTRVDLTSNAEAIVFEVSLAAGNSDEEVVLALPQGAPETFTLSVLVNGASQGNPVSFAAGRTEVTARISFTAGVETVTIRLGEPMASTDRGYSIRAADTTLTVDNPQFRRDLSRHKEILARHGLSMAVGVAHAISSRADQMMSGAGPQASLDVQGRSYFDLPLQSNGGSGNSGGSNGGGMAFWGRVDQDSLSGDDDSFKWDGDVGNTHIGFDYAVNSNLAIGLIHTTSSGSFSFDDTHDSAVLGSGDYDNSISILNPWLVYKLDSGVKFLGSFGIAGSGSVDVMGDGQNLGSSDASADSMFLGVEGPLTRGKFALGFKGQYISGGVDMDASTQLSALSGSASTIKVAVEGAGNYVSESGAKLSPTVTLGFRSDSGDVAGSSGLEIGAGINYSSAGGFAIGGNFRTLSGGDYEESGFSFALSYQGANANRGLSFSLTPSWGDLRDTQQQLWSDGFASLIKPIQPVVHEVERSVQTELSYSWASSLGVWTPYSTAQWSETGTGSLQLGARLQVSEAFGLELASELGADAGEDSSDLRLQGTLRF